MQCPYCGEEDTRVVDSRPAEGGEAIRRRRECPECTNRFTTYERREASLMVQKRDGSVEPFLAAKVLTGVSYAVADRPVALEIIEGLVHDVESFAHEAGPLVASEDIGKQVLEGLREIDEIAYLRFASVHKEFEDASDFEREMAALEDGE